jgi:flagellar FliL protein
MSDAHPPKTEEAPAEGAPKKKNKKVIFIALGVVLLVAGAGVPMFLMGGAPEEAAVAPEEEEHHEEEKHLETADLGSFVVNLSEATSFLKAHLLVEFDNAVVEKQMKPHAEGEAHAAEEGGGGHGGGEKAGAAPLPEFMAKREIQIRDTILKVLSSKKADDVLTPDGKERLKDELIEGLNEAVGLEEPPLTAVYFTEFIIQ